MVTALRYALERTGLNSWPSPLRPTMSWLAMSGLALVFLPLLPGLYWALAPGLSLLVWQALWDNAEWPQALLATLASSLLSTALALVMAGGIAIRAYPERPWLRLQRRLPLLLAVPHAAFAVGLLFLLAPSGWLARLVALAVEWSSPPEWALTQDPLGLSLALALAIKECWFLLWILGALLGEQAVSRQMTVSRSLGYSRLQTWRYILIPQILPRMAWPLAAVFAYGLSVVDMAVILGPSNPPTLAVLIWRWLTDADPRIEAMGSFAAILMLILLLAIAGSTRALWWLACRIRWQPTGKRAPAHPENGVCSSRSWIWPPLSLAGYLVVALLLAWSLAETWFFPALWPDGLSLDGWRQTDLTPFLTSLWLGVAVCMTTLPITLLWLEWGPSRLNALLYFPLIVPAMPLVVGQYAALLHSNLDGSALGLIWSHLLWVLPYMVLVLIGPYRAFDNRLMTTAQAFGYSRLRACLTVKWPMLFKPLLAALAVGFAVSIAQYLPTLFAGGGRFATVTTEAVALSAGGSRQILAVQALLQIMLPLLAFGLAAWLPHRAGKNRRGLR